LKTAVVGHIEWMEFAEVERVPRAGDIVHARASFTEPAGGGAVAAVQLVRLAGNCTLYTAIGNDEVGQRSKARLEELGVRVEAAVRRDEPSRHGFTYLDDDHERTITVIGARLHPRRSDLLPWHELEEVDAVYFCAGDAGALQAARTARALVATARVLDTLREGAVELDALVGSTKDPNEAYVPGTLQPPPRLVVGTAGAEGGTWTGAEGRTGHWAAAPLPGPRADSYGAGDSFAAGLAYALGGGRGVKDALDLAARCGATSMTGRGPYTRQLGM
jgi:ribokinase